MKPYLRLLLLNIRKNNPNNEELGKLIVQLVNYTGKLDDIDWPMLFKTSDKMDSEETTEDPEAIRDYRIRFLGFKNFRTFPVNRYPYGLMFTNSMDEVSSLYLVGRNGVGKSSVFSALELLYTGDVSNMELRGISQEKEEKISYLTYGFGGIKPVDEMGASLWVDMTDKHNEQLISAKQIKAICPQAMFCSELDVEKIENENRKKRSSDKDNLFNYVLTQLGYDELFKLENSVKNVLDNYGELRETSASEFLLEEDIKSVIEAVMSLYSKYGDSEIVSHLAKYAEAESMDAFRAQHEDDIKGTQPLLQNLFSEQWGKLESNIALESARSKTPDVRELTNTIDKSNIDSINNKVTSESLFIHLQEMYCLLHESLSNLASVDDILYIFDKLNNDRKEAEKRANIIRIFKPYEEKAITLKVLQTELTKQKEKLLENFKKDFGRFIEEALFFYSDNYEKFEIDRTHDAFRVHISVLENDEEKFNAFPAEYLNSFRYKLYCVSLKIAMAFYFMKLNKCLLPIVIDDMFSASDFENTQAIEFFVNRIYETYQTVVGFKESLQLILLTHDEVVLEAFRNGTLKHSEAMMRNIREKGMDDPAKRFRCGRLFSYREAEKIHAFTMPTKKYYQLYVKL